MPSTTVGRSAKIDLGVIVAHPLRAKALDVLARRTASPTEIAYELGISDVGKVAYHVRKLEEVEAVELVDERKVRGAIEHFFRGRVLPYFGEEVFAALPLEKRLPNTTYCLQLSFASIVRALDAGTFEDRPDRWLTRVPAQVDLAGWEEMKEIHAELYERTMKVREASANRIAEDPSQPTIKVTQVATFFEEP